MSNGNSARVAVVTGAAQGIGRSIAERLAGDGLDVAVVDLENQREGLEEVAAVVGGQGRSSSISTCDVSDAEQVEAMTGQVVDELGSLDVFVANAGIAQVEPLLDTPRRTSKGSSPST